MNRGSFWQRGQMARVAEEAGVSYSYLSDVLHRRRSVGKEKAIELAEASSRVLGYALISWEEWLFSTTSNHPAFFGQPIED